MVKNPSHDQFRTAEEITAEKLAEITGTKPEPTLEERVAASLKAVEESFRKAPSDTSEIIREKMVSSDDPIMAAAGKGLNEQIIEEMRDFLQAAEYIKASANILMEDPENLTSEQRSVLENYINIVEGPSSQLKTALDVNAPLPYHRMDELRNLLSRAEKEIKEISTPLPQVQKEEAETTLQELLRRAETEEFAPQQPGVRAAGEEVRLRSSPDAEEEIVLPAFLQRAKDDQEKKREEAISAQARVQAKEMRGILERGDKKALAEFLLQVPGEQLEAVDTLVKKMQAAIEAEKAPQSHEIQALIGSKPRPEKKAEGAEAKKEEKKPGLLSDMGDKMKKIFRVKEKQDRQEPTLGEAQPTITNPGRATREAKFFETIAQGMESERPMADQPRSPHTPAGQAAHAPEKEAARLMQNLAAAGVAEVVKEVIPAPVATPARAQTAGDAAKEALARMYPAPDNWQNHTMIISQEQAEKEWAQQYARQTGETLAPEARLQPGTLTPEIAKQRQDIARMVAAELQTKGNQAKEQRSGWDNPDLLAEAEAFANQGQAVVKEEKESQSFTPDRSAEMSAIQMQEEQEEMARQSQAKPESVERAADEDYANVMAEKFARAEEAEKQAVVSEERAADEDYSNIMRNRDDWAPEMPKVEELEAELDEIERERATAMAQGPVHSREDW